MRPAHIGIIVYTAILLAGISAGRQAAMHSGPPCPGQVYSGEERVFDRSAILHGQRLYQQYLLSGIGSLWGQGNLYGPDFAATTLHLVAASVREYYARRIELGYHDLSRELRLIIDDQATREIQSASMDIANKTLRLTPALAYALEKTESYWNGIFSKGNRRLGVPQGCMGNLAERISVARFLFWSAWASGTRRPGSALTYTGNQPYEPSVGNSMPADFVVRTMITVALFLFIFGPGAVIANRFRSFLSARRDAEPPAGIGDRPAVSGRHRTAYFFISATVFFLGYAILGAWGGLIAPYKQATVAATASAALPYHLVHVWQTQCGILGIAAVFIGTSLRCASFFSRVEGPWPSIRDRLDFILFAACMVIALGSLVCGAVGVGGMSEQLWRWIGHPGWEHPGMGLIWRGAIFVVLILWGFCVLHPMHQVRKSPNEDAMIISWFTSAVLLVSVFFASGILLPQQVNYSMADNEYGIMMPVHGAACIEFFVFMMIGIVLMNHRLLDRRYVESISVIIAGVLAIQTIVAILQHYLALVDIELLFSPNPVFGMLRIFPPLVFIMAAWNRFDKMKTDPDISWIRWPLVFLTASVVWYALGKGVSGLIMQLPMIDYYAGGSFCTKLLTYLVLTGAGSMLMISFILFVQGAGKGERRYFRLLPVLFVGLNAGLLFFLIGLLPIGISQITAIVGHGLNYARGPEFITGRMAAWLSVWRLLADIMVLLCNVLFLVIVLTTCSKRKSPAPVTVGPAV